MTPSCPLPILKNMIIQSKDAEYFTQLYELIQSSHSTLQALQKTFSSTKFKKQIMKPILFDLREILNNGSKYLIRRSKKGKRLPCTETKMLIQTLKDFDSNIKAMLGCHSCP